MFNNIGGKLKDLAVAITVIGMYASAITSIIFLEHISTMWIGFLILVLGSLFSWLGSFFVYGFGQLIESTQKIENKLLGNQPNFQYPVEQQLQYTQSNSNTVDCSK